MAKSGTKRVLRYSFGAAVCLVAAVNVLVGTAWYLCLIVAVAGAVIINGSGRRIFRAGVDRRGEVIFCRYIPWYEGNAYVLNVLVPLLGAAGVAAGSTPGNLAWLRYVGFLLLALTPVFLYGAIRAWRLSLLRITPLALTLQVAERRYEPVDIRRELVQSVEPKLVSNPVNSSTSLQIEIAYRAVGGGGETTTVIVGRGLTVEPINLANALVVWRDGADTEPAELMERVERLLQGRSAADV